MTLYKNLFTSAFCLAMVLFGLQTQAQSPVELDKLYGSSKHPVVVLESKTLVNLEVDKNNLNIAERTYQRNYYTSALTNGYGKVDLSYEPPFTAFEDISANLYIPDYDKDDYDREKVRDFMDRKVLDNDVFHNGTRAKYFEFEGLRKGSITEMDYVKNVYEPHLIGREIFNTSTLVLAQSLVIEYANDINLEFEYFNCDSSWFEVQQENLRGDRKKITWTRKNIEPLENEDYALPFLARAPHIVYRVKSYRTKDGELKNITNSSKDLYSWYSSLIDFEAELDSATKHIADTLVAHLKSPKAKAKAIYNWVNGAIRYIAIEDGIGGFKPREANLVCNRRYGDCKDMSNLMVSMMRYAGLDAYHTWVGTRDLPYTYTQTPSVLTDNHMICALRLNDQWLFIDATNKNLPFPMPSSFTQGKEALVGLNASEHLILPIPVVPASTNTATDLVTVKLENNSLLGSGQSKLKGYHAYYANNALETNEQERKEDYVERAFQKGNNKCKTTLNNYENSDTSCTLNYSFSIPGYAKSLGDKLFVNLNLEKPFDDRGTKPEREGGLDFQSETTLNFSTQLEIPNGYQVAFLPENSEYQNPLFAYTASYKKADKNLAYNFTLTIKTLELNRDELEDWNQFIDALKKVYNQTLTLEKI
jgi:hypothetical protein